MNFLIKPEEGEIHRDHQNDQLCCESDNGEVDISFWIHSAVPISLFEPNFIMSVDKGKNQRHVGNGFNYLKTAIIRRQITLKIFDRASATESYVGQTKIDFKCRNDQCGFFLDTTGSSITGDESFQTMIFPTNQCALNYIKRSGCGIHVAAETFISAAEYGNLLEGVSRKDFAGFNVASCSCSRKRQNLEMIFRAKNRISCCKVDQIALITELKSDDSITAVQANDQNLDLPHAAAKLSPRMPCEQGVIGFSWRLYDNIHQVFSLVGRAVWRLTRTRRLINSSSANAKKFPRFQSKILGVIGLFLLASWALTPVEGKVWFASIFAHSFKFLLVFFSLQQRAILLSFYHLLYFMSLN